MPYKSPALQITLIDEHSVLNIIFFGDKTSINENELTFSLSEKNMKTSEIESNESIMVLGIIVIISIGAAMFYLKGYKK